MGDIVIFPEPEYPTHTAPAIRKWRKPADSTMWFSVGPKSTREPQIELKVAMPWPEIQHEKAPN